MRDLIALLLFAISGYFIFHGRAENPVRETSFKLAPIPYAPAPAAPRRHVDGAIDI